MGGQVRFPIQRSSSPKCEQFTIPWVIAEKAYVIYCKRYGSSQSLERIAERGGFGLIELITYLADKPNGMWS